MKQPQFSLHPRLGYQNTDFVLWSNDKKQSLTVTLFPEEEKIFLPENRTHVVKRFSEGEHVLRFCDEAGNVVQEESFKVEDCIKVGGGRVTGRFVLPHWIIIVMQDRTYFHNRETQDEFVEYAIYPESVTEVTEDILCFLNYFTYKFFSVSRLTSILQVEKSELIHWDEDKIIYIEDKTISFFFTHTGEKISVENSPYMVNKNKDKMFLYDSSEECLQVVNLKSSILDYLSLYLNTDFDFKTFIKERFLLFKDKELNIYFYDTETLSFSFKIPLKPILLENDQSLNPRTEYYGDSISVSWNLKIIFLDIPHRAFIIEKVFHELDNSCPGFPQIESHTTSSIVFDNDISNAMLLGEVHSLFQDGKFVVFERRSDKALILLDLNKKSTKEIKDVKFLQHNDIGVYFKTEGDA